MLYGGGSTHECVLLVRWYFKMYIMSLFGYACARLVPRMQQTVAPCLCSCAAHRWPRLRATPKPHRMRLKTNIIYTALHILLKKRVKIFAREHSPRRNDDDDAPEAPSWWHDNASAPTFGLRISPSPRIAYSTLFVSLQKFQASAGDTFAAHTRTHCTRST